MERDRLYVAISLTVLGYCYMECYGAVEPSIYLDRATKVDSLMAGLCLVGKVI